MLFIFFHPVPQVLIDLILVVVVFFFFQFKKLFFNVKFESLLWFLSTESSGMDGKSSSCLISSVKNFDSILSVYDGFCNLKQVFFFFFNDFGLRISF